MAGAGISGMNGDVKIGSTSIFEICKWGFNPKANVAKYASNKTLGYKKAVPGVKDGSGNCEGKWVPANPAYTTGILVEGTLLTLNLYINATQFWQVPSCVESFKIDVDLDTGDVIGWTCDFQTDGAWIAPVAGLLFDPSMAMMGPNGAQVFGPNVPLQEEGVPLTPEQTLRQQAALADAQRRQIELLSQGQHQLTGVSEDHVRAMLDAQQKKHSDQVAELRDLILSMKSDLLRLDPQARQSA